MTGTTVATHRATTTMAFGSGGVQAALAVGALLVMALLVALFLAMQPGHGARATTLPAQDLVQQDPPINQPTEPIYFAGRPYYPNPTRVEPGAAAEMATPDHLRSPVGTTTLRVSNGEPR